MKGLEGRRSLVLLVTAPILPSLAVVAFGLGMIAQERELSGSRAVEARSQAVSEVRQEMLARLERIKTQEISANPDIDAPPAGHSDTAVAFVGWEEHGRLVLPWNRDRAAARFRQAIADPEYVRKIDAAEASPGDAIPIYRAALQGSQSASQSAHARFLLARALDREGRRESAAREYRDLLALPTRVVDDQGMPFAFYAAHRLLQTAPEDVAARLAADLDAAAGLPPLQAYFLRGTFDSLPVPHRGATDALLRRIATLEQSIGLQDNYASLQLTPAAWVSYGDEPWLIGVSPPRPDDRRLVVGVRAADIFRALENQHASSRIVGLRLVSGGDSGAELGDSLPGLRALFTEEPQTGGRAFSLQSFYLLSLVMVLALTFVGGYLVWRDTRRELALADLRSQFVANVSHELKTPLTSIRMFAEALQMRGFADERRGGEYLETIASESERLTRLLDNVLDFSRIERGEKHHRVAPVSLADIVSDAARTMKYPLERQGFDLRLDIAADVPPVHADRDAVTQAILNLLTNAMKYSGTHREIGLRLARQNGRAIIQVIDHGIGIPASEQSRIFEKFYRVPGPSNATIAGAGLGLALVSHIAAAHGGTVSVDSAPGAGSTFSLSLPLAEGMSAGSLS